jgi:2-polyprenyl-3-methyl-5-hydroxy-6-metoxy-1,4-benzoquinol methylase
MAPQATRIRVNAATIWNLVLKITHFMNNFKRILSVDNWHSYIENEETLVKYDMVSCLNLLDRCDKPVTILKQIHTALKPNGLLVVALVMPFRPYVEYNTNNQPSEQMPFKSSSSTNKTTIVNEQIATLVDEVFKPIGFDLVRFSRVPYLCEGNLSQAYYYLIDYLFIFKKASTAEDT